MYRYCVDFESSSADWIGYAANSDQLADGASSCSRAWVVMESADFSALVTAVGGAGTGQFTAAEVAALKLQAAQGVPSAALSPSDGAVLAWGVVLAWAAGWAGRQIVRAFRGTASDESA